jgi:hypothetical protein
MSTMTDDEWDTLLDGGFYCNFFAKIATVHLVLLLV